ncbi:transcriptional regulator [Methanobrevibacter sp.]|uniref:transcriptional regulator n=1 Tax=Methanobrevibacter sp. TaxID=66852 RepID=UPI00386685CA
MDDETLKVFAYVNISSYRVKTVKVLKGQTKTPSAIARDSGIKLNHISKVLRQLKNWKVVECLNEDAHHGRLYRLTSVGDEIVDHLDNFG